MREGDEEQVNSIIRQFIVYILDVIRWKKSKSMPICTVQSLLTYE